MKERFDYIGDSVWETAWRLFERVNFKEMTGWHRMLRKQVVTSNEFMGMLAIVEDIKPLGISPKALADGFEDMLGRLEVESPGSGVKTALAILERRIAVQALATATHKRIQRMHPRQNHPKPIGSNPKFILENREQKDLGKLF